VCSRYPHPNRKPDVLDLAVTTIFPLCYTSKGCRVFDGVAIVFASAHPLTLQAGVSTKSRFGEAQYLEEKGGSPPPPGDAYFVTRDMVVYPEVAIASARKVSVSDPRTNGYVLDILHDSLSRYSPPKEPFTHRYITN
jgi:hypothetical protein